MSKKVGAEPASPAPGPLSQETPKKMGKAKRTVRARARKGGRPKLPAELVAGRRLTVRIYGEDETSLARLCEQLKVSESEAVRRALRALAAAL